MKFISPIFRFLCRPSAQPNSFRYFAAMPTNSEAVNAEKISGGSENEQKTDQKMVEDEPWKDPYKQILTETETYSDYREAVEVDWENVRRLLPRKIIPEMPKMQKGHVTPSGWRTPPKTPPPDAAYYIRRGIDHMPELYLERRRDLLNPKTMDFEYVELVTLRGIHGDIFACERDLREYLEKRLGHPVATHVDELKGLIKVKGADRTLMEQFVYDAESGFTLCRN